MKYLLPVEGGDTVLIDLGGYGIEVCLDKDKRWYDVRYVEIDYEQRRAMPLLLPADMVITDGGEQITVAQATMVRIWRHQT